MDIAMGESGVLDAALELVKSELPPGIAPEEQARLAVKIYTSWVFANGLSQISSSLAGLTMTLETLGSRNSG